MTYVVRMWAVVWPQQEAKSTLNIILCKHEYQAYAGTYTKLAQQIHSTKLYKNQPRPELDVCM